MWDSWRVMIRLVLIGALVAGCSESYNAERLFWRAGRLTAPLVQDAALAKPGQIDQAIKAYQRVADRFPRSIWAARALLEIGALADWQGRPEQARQAYQTVSREYRHHRELDLKARFQMARTYEAQQQWDEAEAAYRELSERYPWSTLGLEAPLYVAQQYKRRRAPDLAEQEYQQVVARYTTLLPDAPSQELANRIKVYLAMAYQGLGSWDKAIETLEDLAQHSAGINRPLILLTLGALYQTQAHDPARAQGAYSTLLEEFPDHPLGRVAKLRLEHLGIQFVPVSEPDGTGTGS